MTGSMILLGIGLLSTGLLGSALFAALAPKPAPVRATAKPTRKDLK